MLGSLFGFPTLRAVFVFPSVLLAPVFQDYQTLLASYPRNTPVFLSGVPHDLFLPKQVAPHFGASLAMPPGSATRSLHIPLHVLALHRLNITLLLPCHLVAFGSLPAYITKKKHLVP